LSGSSVSNRRTNRSDVAAFLRKLPVPYPSYYDRDASIARVFRGGIGWPTTAFYNARGHLTRRSRGFFNAPERIRTSDLRFRRPLGLSCRQVPRPPFPVNRRKTGIS
jgi:hypothetical protein